MDSGMYTEREMQGVKEGMGAVRSVLTAITVSLPVMPATCWPAPEMPSAR